MRLQLWRMSRRRALGWLAAITTFLGLSTVLDACGYLESKLVYFPSRATFLTPRGGVEDVFIPTTDGLKLHAWFIPAQSTAEPRTDAPPGTPALRVGSPPPVILHVHGNAGNIAEHAGFSDFLPRAGFSVLLFDYRGYGRSDLSPRKLNRRDLIADTDAALAYLLTRPDVDQNRIGLYGVSLGAVIGLDVAARHPEIKAAAELSGFSSWKRIARDHMGLLGAVLMRSGHDARDAATRFAPRPLLIIHGADDPMIPVAHAHRIQAAAAEAGAPVEIHIIPGAQHNDIVDTDPATPGLITAFFRRTLPPP